MSLRVQVILEERDALKFRSQATKESKSLSAWLRDAGKKMLEIRGVAPLADVESLKLFFKGCREREKGREPEWEEHKQNILRAYKSGDRP
jgi:hypothetical protein